jgi:tetratricopeptide (TPR) repeat protein
MAYLQAADVLVKSDKRLADENRQKALLHWRAAIDFCPDAQRFATSAIMARQLGEQANAAGDLLSAEQYWTFAADSLSGQWDARAEAMGYLSSLRLLQGRTEEAYRRADQGVKLTDNESLRLARARGAVAFAKTKLQAGDTAEATRLLNVAREDLGKIPDGSELSKYARELQQDPLLSRQ